MMEVFYVEDDKTIADSVKEYLNRQNCKVAIFETVTAVKKALQSWIPALVLIDWNLPDGEGKDLCLWIRERVVDLPIIILTVRGDSQDVVAGFQSGADDYVVKPFELTVLYSRMLALLRRVQKAEETKLFCDDLVLDKERLTVSRGQKEIVLSQSEYHLLLLLMENKGKTITRTQLLEQIWDNHGHFVNNNTLTVTVKRLREKLCNPTCLKTVRSFGYRMEDTI
ncbi:response regulator transcription factor [Blautia hydrogenotrophica]|uniref:Stage 0 sporulation protein A homolog n=1 Tax=Blautia hydrogenotrophica (strain DSM 10507 / JCM 14656 / S5a33) TaxID=476272 RepID=C0CKM2_BLAHS|nr:response regulator transcription factor [Blautia hydrogenotrophica]EEG49712.1 response regulator receiver domain protein [Blautia hydrogenotrophica DSM 10507]MCT6795725.1 response regulator transcription factor [Blautia hydrogenotrophica]